MKLLLSVLLLFLLAAAILPQPVDAQLGIDRANLPKYGGIVPTRGNSAQTLGVIVKNLIILFYTVGTLGFTIMTIWGSVDWILSGGDKEKVAGARKRITTALVGLFLLALSFPIIGIIAQISGINIFDDLLVRNLTT